nr:MAG TPA: hypothetical protein [Crassvirales sp.]
MIWHLENYSNILSVGKFAESPKLYRCILKYAYLWY